MSIQYIIENHFGKGTGVPKAFRPFVADLVRHYSPQDAYLLDQQEGKPQDQRIEARELLARNEEKYASIIEHMGLGLIEIDLEGKISHVDEYFCKMTGYTPEELVGKLAVETLITDQFKINFIKQFQHKKKGRSGPYEMQIRKKNGKLMWILVGAIPLLNDDDQSRGSLGICQNITRQKKEEKKLIEAMQKAEDSAKAKEQFLANMSHEIRTPMNAIVGMSSLLQKTSLNETQQKYLYAITSSANNLLVIINDILDLSKVEAGKIVFEKIGFSIPDIIASVQTSLLYKAQEKGIQLLVHLEAGVDQIVKGDPTRLNQILLNLVNNAIKFTPKGKVEIICKVLKAQEHHVTLEFIVSDTGIGISHDKLGSIFESFSQADASTSRQYGGTGLGLSICKKLIEAQGGNIQVQSEPKQGSTFSFVLAFEKGTEKDLPPKKEDISCDSCLENVRILLAEDNKFNQMLIIALAETWGCHIDIAANGAVALEMLQARTYDLVLMDMQMPVMDGIEATKIIREHPEAFISHIPIIALTANSFASDTKKCLAAGMNDYLSKPFEPTLLYRKIVEILKNTQKLAVLPKLAPQQTPICKDGLLFQIAEGNAAFTIQMLELFMAEVAPIVQEMHTLLPAKDLTNIKRLAHRLKASIDSVATQDAQELIRKVEAEITEGNMTDLIAQLQKTTHELFESCRTEIQNLQAGL